MSKPPCPPAESPDQSWDECVRSGSWTIGLGTIAGAIGTMVLGTETPIFVGTGLGMAWSLKRCRSLFREKETRDCVYLQECQCPPTPCYPTVSEGESSQEYCNPEQETPPEPEEPCPPPETQRRIIPGSDRECCKVKQPEPEVCKVKEPEPDDCKVKEPEPDDCKVKEPEPERCYIPGSDRECCKVKQPEPDDCKVNEPEPERCYIPGSDRECCKVKQPEPDDCKVNEPEPERCYIPGSNKECCKVPIEENPIEQDECYCSDEPIEKKLNKQGNGDDAYCSITPPECTTQEMEKIKEDDRCTCNQIRPPPPIACTCPPPPSEICTCNRLDMEPRTESPQNCCNTNIFKWPPLLNFSQAKTQSYPCDEDLVCTCDDDDDDDD